MTLAVEVVLGQVVKAVGLRGEVKLRASRDWWDAALGSASLRLVTTAAARPVRVESARRQAPELWVLRFGGVRDRDAAEALVGAELVLTELDVALPERPRSFQVCGLRVVDATGAMVGTVAGVEAMPAQELLVVHDGEREHRIPWVPAIVTGVDLEAGEVRVDLPEGLLEL